MTPDQFANKIKEKYPEYKDMDNTELTRRILNKYPQYESQVSLPEIAGPEQNLSKKLASGLDTVFGGGKVGEAIGTQIAKSRASEEEKTFIEGPTKKEVVGDVLRAGALFTPFGKIAKGISAGAKAVGLTKGAQTVGNIGAGATTGAVADVGVSLSEGEKAQLGFGTLLGAGVPAASPLAGAIVRTTAKLAGRGSGEIVGALTGTSQETLQQAFEASRKGGKELGQFTDALRGKTTPEKLVNSLKENVAKVNTERQTLFKETLGELGDISVPTQPAKNNFINELQGTGISVNENGLLDFSNSKLRTVPNAQAKLQQAWDEINRMPEQLTLSEIDTTRQAIKGIKSIAGDDPSANLANMLIDDAVRSVRKAGEQVDGYGAMLDNFAETSDFLDELQRGLSSGDKATIDQTYRRMATALKTNNEQRMSLIRELDEATDGAILSEISGQQLSELMPRGIFRQIAAGLAGGAALSGGVSPSLLPALVLASPRVVGEFVRALGIGASKTDTMISAIEDARNLLLKAGILGVVEFDDALNDTK